MPYELGERFILTGEQTFGSYTFPAGTLAFVRDAFGSPSGRTPTYIMELRAPDAVAAMTIELAEAVIDEVFTVWTPPAFDVFLGPTADFPLPVLDQGDVGSAMGVGVFPASLDDLVAVEVRPPPPPVQVPIRAAPTVPLHFAASTSMAMSPQLVADRVRTLPMDLLTEHVVEGDRGEFVAIGQVFRKGPFKLGELLVRFTSQGQREWSVVTSSISGETGDPTDYTLRVVRDASGDVQETRRMTLTAHQLVQQGWRRLPFERGTKLRRALDGYPGQVDAIYNDGRVTLLVSNAVTGETMVQTVWFDDLDESWERIVSDAPTSSHGPQVRRTAWEWLENDDEGDHEPDV